MGEEDLAGLASVASTCTLLRWYIYEVSAIPSNPVRACQYPSCWLSVVSRSQLELGASDQRKSLAISLRLFLQDPDKALWRELHLQRYDDPRRSIWWEYNGEPECDWKVEMKDRYQAETKFLENSDDNRTHRSKKDKGKSKVTTNSDSPEQKAKDTIQYWSEIDRLGNTLLSLYQAIGNGHSRNVEHLESILRSQAFEDIYRDSFAPAHRYPLRFAVQKQPMEFPHGRLAQLHCLTGWFTQEAEVRALERQLSVHNGDKVDVSVLSRSSKYLQDLGRFRSITYSIRNFSRLNDFGPFHPDGTTNWQLVDAIASVMDANITYVKGHSRFRHLPFNRWELEEWSYANPPSELGIQACRGKSLTQVADPNADWAEVEGTWRGTYAFMDYTDWIQYNYSNLAVMGAREPIDLNNYIEAVGNYMKMELKFGLHGDAQNLPHVRSNLPASDLLPPVDFSGASTNGAQVRVSDIRGQISLTPDDPPQVRWTWMVRYGGEDRWRLDGVQIGGRGSKRGVVGVWSDVDRADLS